MTATTIFTSDTVGFATAAPVSGSDALARITAQDARDTWQPWSAPTRLPARFTGPIADRINARADDLDAKVRRVAEIEQDGRDKQAAAQELNARVDAAIEQNARDVGDGQNVIDAQAQRARFLSTHDPDTWRKQLDAARAQIDPARAELDSEIETHALALANELKPAAAKVHADIKAAEAAAEAALTPLRREHDELTDTLAMLLGRTAPILRTDIPIGDYARAPYVSHDALDLV